MIKTTLLLSGLLSLSMFGQDYPVNQVSIGASASGIVNGPASILVGPNFAHTLSTRDRGNVGFDTSYTRNLNQWFGLKSNFSAYFSSGSGNGTFNSVSQKTSSEAQGYNFEFGPQFRFQNRTRITPYVQTLAGVAHVNGSFDTAGAGLTRHDTDSRTGASLVFGGGLDIRVISRMSIRMGMDYNPTFLGAPYSGASSIQNNVRLNLGLVIHSRYDR